MSDFIATALGLGFALVVCLLAIQAILGPWLRVRRAPTPVKTRSSDTGLRHTPAPETTPVRSS